jgi:hypothetical protein
VFIDGPTLSQAVHDVLQKSDTAQLAGYWPTLINQALRFSYWEIVNRLAMRGYSKAIIDQWDRGAEFQQDLGVWHALQWISTQTAVKIEMDSLHMIDRRGELESFERTIGPRMQVRTDPVMVTINGVIQHPDTSVGQAVTGPIEGGGALGYPWERPAANGPAYDGRPRDPNFELVGG